MAVEYTIQIVGNVQRCRTEAEVYLGPDSSGLTAIVYESRDGWSVELMTGASSISDDQGLEAAVAAAKERLSHYVNRLGHDPPEGLAPVGLSLWLMLKDDGTALGKPVDWL